ncbi:serine/threonine protein kinase [Shimazuella alba]|uniref:Serine/threonine protein kinase n=1 Tax=Shimazuella alba TaxID=2690964 RepID=A0A6I4VTR8_9BACL|nr:serine/threonine protein kinase [Shimazuella alba]MXQ55169.1 serine/threonine protein kinase [Shimazuella alba]
MPCNFKSKGRIKISIESDPLKRSTISNELSTIKLEKKVDSQEVTVLHIPGTFQIIGVGTDAVVVQHETEPTFVYKIYVDQAVHKCEVEYSIYEQLKDCKTYAVCYEKGPNFLKLSYEKGPTLYQCLEQGVEINPEVIEEVEAAREYARQKGLNPRDIHLGNVIFQDGHAKIIDVSEYRKSGNDNRWEHLVEGYHMFYSYIKGMKIPTFLIETVKKLYKQEEDIARFFTRLRDLLTF